MNNENKRRLRDFNCLCYGAMLANTIWMHQWIWLCIGLACYSIRVIAPISPDEVPQ